MRAIGLVLLLLLTLEQESLASQTKEPFLRALDLIGQTHSGRSLIEKAMQVWGVSDWAAFSSTFEWGKSSRTDTILTRHYDPLTRKEVRQRQMTVYLKEDQSLIDLCLDMTHELVHATARPMFDPYDASLTAGKYIQLQIEGVGGEIDAVMAECQVAAHLRSQYGLETQRCSLSARHLPKNREHVKADFYRVGRWYTDLTQRLGAETKTLPQLSGRFPTYLSSTGHAPYPIALLLEYTEMTRIACKNSEIRLENGSEDDSRMFLNKRCY
jgi:hypothetical protein